MVDHLSSTSKIYLQNHRKPFLDFVNKPELMELNIEMSCMNISEAKSECNNAKVPICSKNVDIVINEISNTQENISHPKRSLRKRIRPVDYTKEKIEILPKIQKLSKGPISQGDIEKYYLCKNTKRLHPTLETIYEEPKNAYNKSKKKLKRSIEFDPDPMFSNKVKLKKRLLRAKQLPSSNIFLNRKKVSMESLLKKLANLESDTE